MQNTQRLIRQFAILIAFLVCTAGVKAQLFTEGFDGMNPYANWDTNTTDLGSLVGGSVENHWIINAAYSGLPNPTPVPNTPPQPAAISNSGGNYLHILSRSNAQLGAFNANYTFASSASGDRYFTRMNTDINTTGQTNVFLRFWMLNEATGPAGSSGQVYYSINGGANWILLNQYSGVTNWTQQTISNPAFDNQPTLRFGFMFVNPAAGSSPGFAVDDIEVDVAPPLTATVNQPSTLPTTLCTGDTITFIADDNGGFVTQFQWNFDGGNAGPQTINNQTASFTAGNPGTYNFDLIVGNGNTLDTLTFPVTINQCIPPTISFSGTPTQVCQGSNVTFTNNSAAGSQPITQYQWNFDPAGGGNGGTPATFTGANPPAITYNTLGTYDVVLTLTDANGTYSDTLIDYIEVISCPVPVANFQSNVTQICPSECVNFIDQSSNMGAGGSTWFWSFPGSDSTTSQQQSPSNICYQTPGLYDVQLIVNNTNGSDTLLLEDYIQVDSCLAPVANFTVERDSMCVGTCIQFFNTSKREDTYEWQFFGADLTTDTSSAENPIACYSDTGTFDVQLRVTNQYGVDLLYLTDFISVANFPDVVATNDKAIYVGNSVELEAFGTGEAYQWTPEYNTSCRFCRRVTVSPRLNTVYYVTNTNEHGCSTTDSVRVQVDQEYYFGVPDAFSPNGDGENDFLYVRGNGIEFIEFYVYDRFGQLIFESRDQDIGWDGTYKGQRVHPGVYVYYAKVTLLNGRQDILQGDVTLVR